MSNQPGQESQADKKVEGEEKQYEPTEPQDRYTLKEKANVDAYDATLRHEKEREGNAATNEPRKLAKLLGVPLGVPQHSEREEPGALPPGRGETNE